MSRTCRASCARRMAMPDIHWGYGFPIGGVAAVDEHEGVVSPGGVGYDINCGVRLMTTKLAVDELRPRLRALAHELQRDIPAGVGSSRAIGALDAAETKRVLQDGAAWAVARGFGTAADLERTEEGGRLAWAEPDRVSETALRRGGDQVGTLGSGNHFLEVDRVERDLRRGAGARLRPLFRAALPADPFWITRARLSGLRRQPGRRWTRRWRATASTCPIGSSPARRSLRPRGVAISAPWPPPPTSPGPTARP